MDIMERSAREALIIERRTQRVSFPKIGAELGITHQRVQQIFQTARDRIPAARLADLRAEESELLDQAIAGLLVIATGGKSEHARVEAWRAIIAASESKRKLFGADAPVRREVTVLTESVVDAALRKINDEHAALVAQAVAAGVDVSETLTEAPEETRELVDA
ncbi:hypothetical protein [Mycobacterium sp.]|uniref:hypothetical protein n=1 Tax=Mycobacterium sp. TaxID=1785 RepID=UPI003CC61AC9